MNSVDVKSYHTSVLVSEVIRYMAPKPHGVYVDATFGGGGHTKALLDTEPTCKVIAIDWDERALELNAPSFEQQYPGRVTFIWGNFAHIARLLKKAGVAHVDGVLADFGTSQFQILHRPGLSFALDTPLDMRMSPGHHKITARDIVNKAPERELVRIFQEYGEERFSRTIARAICEARLVKPLRTTRDLVALIERSIRVYPRRIHPATRVFQALRIVVNKELDAIKSFLPHAFELLNPTGRLICISFHSLEDRMVKRFFNENKDKALLLTPHVVTACEDELRQNPSARSAKLRALEKMNVSINELTKYTRKVDYNE